MTEMRNPGPHPAPHAPSLTLPDNACDAHCHIFGPIETFPYSENSPYRPAESPLPDLQRLHTLLGLTRAVLVQPVAHGRDHSALVAALEAGRGRYRGVALIGPDTSPDEIERLHTAGVRGARLNFVSHLMPPPSRAAVEEITKLVRPHGWHLSVHVADSGIVELADFVRTLPLPVVIDHMARVDLRGGLNSPEVRVLRQLLCSGSVWVKLSGADRLVICPTDLPDAVALARLLMHDAPERVVWGTDFPHPNTHGFVPDDGDLVDLLTTIAPGPADRRRLLVDNPTVCFDF